MIIDALWAVIHTIISGIFSALPTASLSSVLSDVTTLMNHVGTYLGQWNGYLPISELGSVIVALATVWLPALVTYKLASWIWRHIPEIGGFGTGDG